MPIFGPENVNSVKTTLYYGPKMSIECPFFKKNARKYPIITAKKVKYHFKIHYNIKQKNVKNLKKYNNILKYSIMYTKKKIKKQPTSFFRQYNTSVAKILRTGA